MKIKESDYLLWNIYHSVIALLLGALVVIEGMAAGKPVVATAAGGVLEIIENGVNGGPGTDPLTANRCFSGSMLTTSRFWEATRLLPILPAIFKPLITLLMPEVAPTEPGARCRSDWP